MNLTCPMGQVAAKVNVVPCKGFVAAPVIVSHFLKFIASFSIMIKVETGVTMCSHYP